MPEPLPYSDDQMLDFIAKLDSCGKITVSDWEAGFIESILKGKKFYSDKMRLAVIRMIEKHAPKIPWSPRKEDVKDPTPTAPSPHSSLDDDLGIGVDAPPTIVQMGGSPPIDFTGVTPPVNEARAPDPADDDLFPP